MGKKPEKIGEPNLSFSQKRTCDVYPGYFVCVYTTKYLFNAKTLRKSNHAFFSYSNFQYNIQIGVLLAVNL